VKLLVPLDGSNLSEIVYPWVRLLGSEVELLRSYLPIEQVHLGHGLPITVARLVNDEGADVQIKAYLDEQAQKLAPLNVTTCCSVGHPADAILDHASPHDAIVIASHGQSGISRWLLGSVTTKVVRASTRPVLVVSARPDPKVRPAQLDRIFVPLDGSDTSELALSQAVDLAKKHQAKLTLYEGVIYRSGTPESEDWQALSAKEYLNKKAEALSGLDVEVVVHESRTGPEIVEQADKNGADLIVMGSHGRSGVSRWVLGSVTEGVVQRSNCPVLVVYGRE
jgi:nucleotide-binding universal stress UspA family protein